MPTFKVRMQGSHLRWPSDWAIGKDIELLRCTFTRIGSDQTQNLSVEVEVDALDADEAMNLGKEIILKEFDLFILCAENPMQLDENNISADRV